MGGGWFKPWQPKAPGAEYEKIRAAESKSVQSKIKIGIKRIRDLYYMLRGLVIPSGGELLFENDGATSHPQTKWVDVAHSLIGFVEYATYGSSSVKHVFEPISPTTVNGDHILEIGCGTTGPLIQIVWRSPTRFDFTLFDGATGGINYVDGSCAFTATWVHLNDSANKITIPNITTAQRDAISGPETGQIFYNTTTKTFQGYGGSPAAWTNL